MEDVGGEIVLHGQHAPRALALVDKRADDTDYSAAVEAILAQFRSQAEQMSHAQLEQHKHPAVNCDDVLAIFPAYGEAQVAIQQNTEQRLQTALECSHVESSRALVALADKRAAGTKREIADGVARALDTVGVSTLAEVQEAAIASLKDFASETHDKLDAAVKTAWMKACAEAAEDLQNKLSQFLKEAETHINTVLSKLDKGRLAASLLLLTLLSRC